MTIYIVSSGKGTKLIPKNMRIGQGSFNRRRANNPRREPAREKQKSGHLQDSWMGGVWKMYLTTAQFGVRLSMEACGLGQTIRV